GYRASLDHLLPFREHAVTRARETAFARRQLLADGLASRREAEIAEQRLAEAEAALSAAQAEIVQADRMVAEATAAAVLASLPPTKPGTITVTPLLTRFRGSREWSFAHVPSVERFFSERFHHALPVSALGQKAASGSCCLRSGRIRSCNPARNRRFTSFPVPTDIMSRS